jgi:hypothetical protein
MDPTPKDSLHEAQKKYREANKEKIAERAKEKKYWRTYYEKNKEVVRQKNLERYYVKMGLVKKVDGKVDGPAVDERILRLEGLLKDLREFVPLVRKKKEPKAEESV